MPEPASCAPERSRRVLHITSAEPFLWCVRDLFISRSICSRWSHSSTIPVVYPLTVVDPLSQSCLNSDTRGTYPHRAYANGAIASTFF